MRVVAKNGGSSLEIVMFTPARQNAATGCAFREGNSPVPAFDDGSLDNYGHALPVLDQLSLKASFYIPVDLVEQRVCPWHDRLNCVAGSEPGSGSAYASWLDDIQCW